MASKRREQAKKSKAARKAEMHKGGGQSAYAMRKTARLTGNPTPGSPYHPTKAGRVELPVLEEGVDA